MHSFEEYRDIINENLTSYVPKLAKYTNILAKSMKYSLEVGGKRLRPCLLLAAYEFANEISNNKRCNLEIALPFALAIEYIHTYSLIHDDLPAMDNDDLRRGKLTNHKVFGDDIAILAGDALLNTALEVVIGEIVRNADNMERMTLAARASYEIARRAGATGMIGGQIADVTGENTSAEEDLVRYIEEHKTADLIIAPIIAGLILGGASDDLIDAMSEYALNIGVAFQILDDILDYEGDANIIGKNIGKDQDLGKCNYASVHGIDKAHEELHLLTSKAIDIILPYVDDCPDAVFFIDIAKQLEKRKA